VNPQLRHGFADWRDVSWIARGQPLDPNEDSRSSLRIGQAIDPAGEDVGLPNLDHVGSVAYGLHSVN
jgi:hypothetical protein